MCFRNFCKCTEEQLNLRVHAFLFLKVFFICRLRTAFRSLNETVHSVVVDVVIGNHAGTFMSLFCKSTWMNLFFFVDFLKKHKLTATVSRWNHKENLFNDIFSTPFSWQNFILVLWVVFASNISTPEENFQRGLCNKSCWFLPFCTYIQ